MAAKGVGIDFGTTNSSIASASLAGEVTLASFPYLGGTTDAYRSLLYLEISKEGQRSTLNSWSGPEGIERYLAAEPKGRLIQSLKSFLSSRSLQTTDIFGRRRTLEELISRILRDLRAKAEVQFGQRIHAAVVGRPVNFVGAEDDAQNAYAEARLREAFCAAGFEAIEFELEPVAAAHYYESTLDHDELILIGDFGGGTSDFSLVHVGPTVLKRGRNEADLLGSSGLGFAGDAFDAKIIRHLVSPALGDGTKMRSLNKILPVPSWVYRKLERWHHLSFLRSKDTMSILNSVLAQAEFPQKIAAFVHIIREDLGYHLHKAVQQTKCQLSYTEIARFEFHDGIVDLNCYVTRNDFEEWIADELGRIEQCVDGLLAEAGTCPNDVNMVFLTGGTSFVPSVRKIFESRFGRNRIRTGNEFTSVARGLALKAAN